MPWGSFARGPECTILEASLSALCSAKPFSIMALWRRSVFIVIGAYTFVFRSSHGRHLLVAKLLCLRATRVAHGTSRRMPQCLAWITTGCLDACGGSSTGKTTWPPSLIVYSEVMVVKPTIRPLLPDIDFLLGVARRLAYVLTYLRCGFKQSSRDAMLSVLALLC